MGRYAKRTIVPVDRSKAQIEKMVMDYGATSFVNGWDSGTNKDVIMFECNGRQIMFDVDRPEDPQERRQRWRALGLAIKAKLEAIESGISTFEQEFLAWVLTAQRRKLGDVIIEKLDHLIDTGNVTALLPSDRPNMKLLGSS